MAVEKIVIPDFGDVQQITVVEVFIRVGDSVQEEESLLTLESEKAVMDIPSPYSGTIKEIMVGNDDQVKSGDVIALIDTAGGEGIDGNKGDDGAGIILTKPDSSDLSAGAAGSQEEEGKPNGKKISHAAPSVRAFAREQGVDLSTVEGSGPRGRIQKEDVLKSISGKSSPGDPSQVIAPPVETETGKQEDFSTYGEVQEIPMGRIKKISGPHLHRSWISIPHVTHFDEADISDLEAFRQSLNSGLEEQSVSYSPLVFVIKAVAAALQEFPVVNSSLTPDGTGLLLKKFYHIGIAVETPDGLVVPVIRNADSMGLAKIAKELARLSSSARSGKLAITDMQGATFTVSSLGGIGGTGFTPIVNSPQAAILGLSRSYMKPGWDGKQFVPQLTLPFSFSYDHRIIDGAEAARFCRALRLNLENLKRILL